MKIKDNLIALVSILVGIISLGLAVYQSKNEILQVGYVVALVLSGIVFFVINNYGNIHTLQKENKKVKQEFNKLKEKLNIYDRLNKIESKIFNEGGKMNKKAQSQYILVILLVLFLLFLIYLTFFK